LLVVTKGATTQTAIIETAAEAASKPVAKAVAKAAAQATTRLLRFLQTDWPAETLEKRQALRRLVRRPLIRHPLPLLPWFSIRRRVRICHRELPLIRHLLRGEKGRKGRLP
jgi:hypothetical protein